MLIGAFDFGQFLFMHQALVERTRSAARWGSVNDPTNATSIKNMVMYNQSTTPGLGTSSYFNLTTSNVDVSTSGYGTDNYTLNVKVSGYSYVVLSPGLTGTFTGPPITVNIPLGLYN
jgi:Flp pilus assembly protein TadG